MAFSLFHTREWWQQVFLTSVMTVSHELNTGTGNKKRAAIFLRKALSA